MSEIKEATSALPPVSILDCVFTQYSVFHYLLLNTYARFFI